MRVELVRRAFMQAHVNTMNKEPSKDRDPSVTRIKSTWYNDIASGLGTAASSTQHHVSHGGQTSPSTAPGNSTGSLHDNQLPLHWHVFV